ncbi:MAG: hypothetical protein K8W52_24715 [Deltaproteobacteria bacterium]|nr:hypothetical protein [Deltaproteobacteria bacterium]
MLNESSYFADDTIEHVETAAETDPHGNPPRHGAVVGLGGQFAGGMIQGDRLSGANEVGAYTLRDAAMVTDADGVLADRPHAEHGDDIGDELAHLLHSRRRATDGDGLTADEFVDDMEFDFPTRNLSTDAAVNRWTSA